MTARADPASADAPGVFATLRATPPAARYLLLGVTINQLGAFVQTFLVLYLVHRGLSTGRAGIGLGVYSLGAVLGTLLGGELTHRLGPRGTITAAMAASALLVFTIPWLSTPGRYAYLLVAVGLAGAATQAYRPAAATLLSDVMPAAYRVMAFSLLRIALNIGAALGPLVAAGLILVNWNLLYWVDGITALAYSALALSLLPPTPVSPATPDQHGSGRSGYRTLFRDTRFLVYLVSMTLGALLYVQFLSVLPLKIDAEGHSTALYSVVLATSSVILITCELKVTSYVQRWVPSIAGAVGTTVLGLGLAGYGLSASAVVIVAATAVFVTGLMVGGPVRFAHAAKAPAAVKSRYIGASQAMFGLGSAVGPAVGVLAWNHLGNRMWLLCGIVGLIAGVCSIIGMRESWEQQPAS